MANKAKETKLVLADLIAKKLEKESKRAKTEDVFIESLGGDVTVQVPEDRVVMKAIDMMKDESMEGIMEAYVYVIYHSVELFKNTELHNEYEVQVPTDIVYKLLELNERLELGDKIMKLSGLADLNKKVKN